MSAVLKSALENLDKALGRLEKSIDKKFAKKSSRGAKQTMLDLDFVDDDDEDGEPKNRALADKLDNTIARLETLLSEERALG